jgi:hypothetical protein
MLFSFFASLTVEAQAELTRTAHEVAGASASTPKRPLSHPGLLLAADSRWRMLSKAADIYQKAYCLLPATSNE